MRSLAADGVWLTVGNLSFDSINVVANLKRQTLRENSGMRVKHLCGLSHFSMAANRVQVAQKRDQGALHAKFAASFVLPTPLYFATAG